MHPILFIKDILWEEIWLLVKSVHQIKFRRGYSFIRMFMVFVIVFLAGFLLRFISVLGFLLALLSIPISFIAGFGGSKGIQNGCMNWGKSWIAGS